MTGGMNNAQPYRLKERSCATLSELAVAMVEDAETAQEHLERGYIQKWIEEDLREYDARIALDKLLEQFGIERALFEFALGYAPEWAPTLQGIPLTEDTLTEYLQQTLKDDRVSTFSSIDRLANKIYRWRLLVDERVFKGSERLAAVDRVWREEVEAALRLRGEMLLYAGVYKVPAANLDRFLFADRELEIALAARQVDDSAQAAADFEAAAEAAAWEGKTSLLAELLTADEIKSGFASRYKVEDDMNFEQACQRPWFVDFHKRHKLRTAGHEATLRDAAEIAHAQACAVEHQKNLATEQAAAVAPGLMERVTAGLSGLDRKVQAALFALPVFATLFMLETNPMNGWFFWASVAVGLTIGLVPFRAFAGRNGRAWLHAIVACGFATILILSYEMELWRSSVLYEGLFAAAAGLAGFFREPMLAFRARRHEESLKSAVDGGRNADGGGRISLSRLQVTFFPELTSRLPQAERTQDDYHVMAALQHGTAPSSQLVPYADARSPAAPNNPDGVSINSGSSNFASDRTTFGVMDGVSMDTEGGWNMRVVDGVTLHSDGTHTTRLMDGVDVRSDGQVSTEVAGFRFSSGGKKKEKKDEWDWGTGEKKEKGWFD